MRTRTTAKDFQLFKRESRLWKKRFGLLHWRITFYHEDDDGEPAFAWMQAQYQGKNANLCLSRDWKENEVTALKVRRSAFHEIVHLLLADLVIMGQERWSVQGAYAAEA